MTAPPVPSRPRLLSPTYAATTVGMFALVAFSAFEQGYWRKGAPDVHFFEWPKTTNAFKAGEYGALQDMEDAGLLILDEVGAEHDPSRNAADKLCQILTRRERRFTLVTTNIEPGAAWAEKFDMRIADRLCRNSEVVNLAGCESYPVTH